MMMACERLRVYKIIMTFSKKLRKIWPRLTRRLQIFGETERMEFFLSLSTEIELKNPKTSQN